MYCKKCGSENDLDAVFCSSCGENIGAKAEENLQVETVSDEGQVLTDQNLEEIKEIQQPMQTKKKSGLVAVALILAVLLVVSSLVMFQSSKEDELALNAAKTIQKVLKDPDSLRLYEDQFFVYEELDKEGNFEYNLVVFKYGGANTYGGIVTDYALFVDDEYLFSFSDADDLGRVGGDEVYLNALLFSKVVKNLGFPKEDSDFRKVTAIDVDNIKKKLNLD